MILFLILYSNRNITTKQVSSMLAIVYRCADYSLLCSYFSISSKPSNLEMFFFTETFIFLKNLLLLTESYDAYGTPYTPI